MLIGYRSRKLLCSFFLLVFVVSCLPWWLIERKWRIYVYCKNKRKQTTFAILLLEWLSLAYHLKVTLEVWCYGLESQGSTDWDVGPPCSSIKKSLKSEAWEIIRSVGCHTLGRNHGAEVFSSFLSSYPCDFSSVHTLQPLPCAMRLPGHTGPLIRVHIMLFAVASSRVAS